MEFILSTKKVGSDRLDCLEGIRALSMTWVVLGHSFAFSLPLLFVNNKEFTMKIQKDGQVGLAFQAVTQGEYAVDTFFFIGATLVSYLLHKDLDKTGGWTGKQGLVHMVVFYVNRILRITVPYAFTIMFMISIPPLVIKTPLSAAAYAHETSSACQEYWWHHLLYIHNFVPGAQGCISQSWFLATDMIFFAASPLLIYPLWLSTKQQSALRVASILWCLSFLLLSIAWCLRCTINYSSGGSLEEFCWTDIVQPDFAPWGRRSHAYILGILMGHTLHSTRGKTVKIPTVFAFIIWQTVLLVFFSVIYAPYNTSLLTWKRVAGGGRSMTTLQRFWYSSSHLLWSSALTWLVFACSRGLGGPITQLLTWQGWTPVSKVSFMAYLVHMDFNWIFFFMQVGKNLSSEKM